MVTCLPTEDALSKLHINVHAWSDSVHFASPGALLLRILKPLETQLQQRGLLDKAGGPPVNPLWFLAVTERNLFLWRNGFSLSQRDDFEFWVHPEQLTAKRMLQLELIRDGDVQLMNSSWGMPKLAEATVQAETDYLENLLGVINKIQNQAFALSHAALLIEREVRPPEHEREVVVLPV